MPTEGALQRFEGARKEAAGPLRYTPFGLSSWAQDAFDITEAQLGTVVALCASAVCGQSFRTVAQLTEMLGRRVQSDMKILERGLWVEQVATVKGTTTKVWAATPRAFERLGLKDWQVEQEQAAS